MTPTPRIALLGLPYDASSSLLRGSAGAPPLIRAALHSASTNGWTESMVDFRAPGVLGDAGDVSFGFGSEVRAQIESGVATVLAQGSRPICLGGDHSVTYPIVRAMRQRYPRLALLHFDAHPDLYDSMDGDRYSHGCPFARIMEEGLVDRLVQVGIRTMNRHQHEQATRFGVEVVTMRDLAAMGTPGQDASRVSDVSRETFLRFDDPLYVSVDLDVLDPAFAPGISHREPGGLSVRELLTMIQRTQATAFVGADIVEFNPTVDPAGLTAWVAAKIVRELGARMLES